MNSTSFPVFANVPALVSHQPTLPRDEPTARGRRTCLPSRVPDQAPRAASSPGRVLCGEAKTNPLGVDRERPARSWDGLELPKADALGVVIGQYCRRPFDRPYNLQMRCWGRWAWVSAEQVIWGSVWSIMFSRCSEEPTGSSSPRPQIGKVVQLTRPFLDKALG